MGMTETSTTAIEKGIGITQRHGVLGEATAIVTKLIISQGKTDLIGNGGRRIGMNRPRILLTNLETVLFAHMMVLEMLLIACTECHRA